MSFRLLLSYFYYKDVDIPALLAEFPEKPEVFADSGAYSAWTQNAAISVDEYGEWIGQNAQHFVAYANLDVIQNAPASLENQTRLEALGLRPIPVFHGGEPFEQLEDYCEHYPYVALGGMVKGDQSVIMRWLIQSFRTGQKYGTCFHGFGQTKNVFLAGFPWYSVDSTSWATGHRYGVVALWDPIKAKFQQVQLGQHKSVYKNARLLRAHGGDPAELATPYYALVRDPNKGAGKEWTKPVEQARAERGQVIALNLRAWLAFEEWLRKRWGPIGPPKDWGGRAGPNVYLAQEGGSKQTALIMEGVQAMAGPRLYLATSNHQKDFLEEVADAAETYEVET